MVSSRRFSSIALIVVILVSTLAACSNKQQLNVYNWTEYIPDDVLAEFQQEFNVDLVYDNFTSNEEMYAKLEAGGAGYDITFPSSDFIPLMIEQGMLQPLDKSKLPNLANVSPDVLSKTDFDPGNSYSVPYSFGSTAIVYWKSAVGELPETWDVFANPALKGRIVVLDDMREVIGAALRKLNYSVNSTSAAEIASARDLVNTWKANIAKFDSDLITTGFAAKEFVVAFGYPENVTAEVEGDAFDDVGYAFPVEGGAMYMDSMVILKDAKNVALAYEFINFILRPEIYARIMDAYGYPGLVPAADAYREVPPLYTAADLPKSEFRLDVGPAIEIYSEAWQNIRLGF